MSNECKGIFGKWFGHNYQPRITKGASTGHINAGTFSCSEHFILDMMEKYRPITYECDICTRCGDIINKKDKAED